MPAPYSDESLNLERAHNALEYALSLIPNTKDWERMRRWIALTSDACSMEADDLRQQMREEDLRNTHDFNTGL